MTTAIINLQSAIPNQQCGPLSPPQPIPNIPHYLTTRTATPDPEHEQPLYITLPTALRDEVKYLHRACLCAERLVKGRLSTTKSCARAYEIFRNHLAISLKSFRGKFDLWVKTRDWLVLVNRARAGALWQNRDDGLPQEFLQFCAAKFGAYKRADGKRQALFAIKRQWMTGRNTDGNPEPIPGYGYRSKSMTDSQCQIFSFQDSDSSPYPPGWSYSNILHQIKARGLLADSVRALLHHGTAAARDYLPQVRMDRSQLLFLSEVQFDDVKCDFLIVDPESGQVCDLWLLVARDLATALLLGFGMRPARTREDGTQEHLRLRDMKQLCGWLLERYGLPPYEMTWKIEHGTATLSEGSRNALREMLPGRIDISYSSMIGGASPSGYQQRGLGNSKGKASLESHNRLMHTILADRPGQTGPIYTKRPMDLAARAKEATTILATAANLPAHLRGQLSYPILTINQAREHLVRCFQLQNERTEHELQGFEDRVELWNGHAWVSQNDPSAPSNPSDLRARTRKESPIERCARLIAPYREQWTQVNPDIIATFYSHTARNVVVKPSGLIDFTVEGRSLEFMPPTSAAPQVPGTKLLGYFHPDDPAFLHLTDGQGRIIGTWIRRNRVTDQDTLTQAIRYNQSALKAAKAVAAEYAAPERAQLDAMRAHNAELLAANTFTDVALIDLNPQPATLNSPIAKNLTTATKNRVTRTETNETFQDIAAAMLTSD